MVKLIPLGGCDDIGASAIYVNIDGTGILLDCGTHPKKNGEESLPNLNLLNDLPLDYVFITHAHQDHIGAVPYLIKKFPHVLVYSTPQTQELANLTLHNAVSILEKEMDSESQLLYTHEEIDLLVKSIIAIDYNDEVEIKGLRHKSLEPIYINFFDAGHILGSASILIKYKHKSLWYTGDIKTTSQKILSGAKTPHYSIETVITETTYGSIPLKDLSTLNEEEERFAREVNKIIAKGGSVLVPVFALGKTQELLAVIWNLMLQGKLTDVPIYTGGIGSKISKVYDKNRFLVNVVDKNFEISDIPQENFYEFKNADVYRNKPGIVLAASGMMIKGTKSFELAKYWIRQNDFGIFFVGYVDEDTPANRVLVSSKGEKIKLSDFFDPVERKCEVESFRFPSHSNRKEIFELVTKLKPDNIILVHGESTSRDWFGFNILKEHPNIKVYAPDAGSEIIIE